MEKGCSSRIPTLDGVRALAIALVLIGHSLAGLSNAWKLPALLFGDTGVSLFFVLSGYLITGRMLSDEQAAGKLQLARFYRNRALRIFPAFYAFLIGVAVLAKLSIIPTPDRITWLASAFYFRNLEGSGWETGHLWTLALEEQFYLLWPALFILCKRRRILLISLLIGAFTAHRAFWLHGHELTLGGAGSYRWRPDLRLDTFLVGCGFALSRPGWIKWPLPVLSLAGIVCWNVFSIGSAWTRPLDTPIAAALLSILVVWAAQLSAGPLHTLLSSRPAVQLGALSYSIYLWQQLFLGRPLHWWSFPAIVSLACASYWIVERPFLRLRHRRKDGLKEEDKTSAGIQPAKGRWHQSGVAPWAETNS
jgi:peptidoglycan/LPS O-acetylase OafA/YrhL